MASDNPSLKNFEDIYLSSNEYNLNLEKRRSNFVKYFSYVGIIFLTFFGVFSFSNGHKIVGAADLALAAIALINLISLKFHKNINIASDVIVWLMIVLVCILFVDGGVSNTGILWFYIIPPLAFFLKGKSAGLRAIVVFLIAILILGTLGRLEIYDLKFSTSFLRIHILSFIATALIILFYQNINEKNDKLQEDNRKKILESIVQLKKDVEVYRNEKEVKQKLFVEVEAKNSLLEQNKSAVLNILDDLEVERNNLKLERDKINTILYSIGDAVFVVDKDYRITIFNDICEKLSGFTKDEALGKRYNEILKFISEDTRKENNSFIVTAIEKGINAEMSNHTVLISKDGKEIAVSDSAAPIKDSEGKVIGGVVVFRDVSKERQIDQAKTEFVSLASHQLRTPLSAINWYIEMLTDDSTNLTDDQKEFLQEIEGSNKRMVDLVESLLNVSRIDLGTFAVEPAPTNIVEISTSVVKEMQVVIKEKELVVKENYAPEIPVVNLDPKLTRIIFQNVISNAVKYTQAKGNVEITINKDTQNILISVKDSGVGIPKNQQEKIFSKLFRADNVRGSDVSGTGLGLYIVKSIVDQSKGKIWFESEENKGTTFFIQLPLTGMIQKEGNRELS